MARNVAGFGEGLSQGFGLVNDFYSSQRKADIAEQELASDKAYREGLLEDKRAARKNDRLQNEGLADLRRTQAETSGVNANAAQTRAQADLLMAKNQANKYDESGNLKPKPPTAVDNARINAANAQKVAAIKTSSALDRAEIVERQAASDERAATGLDQLIQFANKGQTSEAFAVMENTPELFSDKSAFSLKAIYNPDNPENFSATNQLLQNAADNGTITEEQANNPYALAGIGEVLGANRSKLVGSKIDPVNFPNAPLSFDQGTMKATGVLNLESNQANELSATVWNEVQLPNGEFAFYYAPLTENRKSSAPGGGPPPKAFFDLNEGAQLLYSRSTAVNYALDNPVAKGIAEERGKIRSYGSVEKFNKELDDRVESFGDLISTRDADSNIQGVSDEYGIDMSMTPGEYLARKDEVRAKIQNSMLYGRSAVSDTRRAQKYLARLRSEVPNFEVTGPIGRRKFKDLIDKDSETLTPGQLSKINEFFVGDDNEFGLPRRKDTIEKYQKFVELLGSMDIGIKK